MLPAVVRVFAASAVCAVLAVLPARAGTDAAGQRSSLAIVDQQSRLAAGEVGHAIVDVTNRGPGPWPARGAVRLSYRWLDGVGQAVEHEARETLLLHDVAPGSTLRVCAGLVAPAVAGRYAIKWDLAEEGATWLSERDLVTPAFQMVEVTAPRQPDAEAGRALLVWLLVNLLHGTAAAWVAWRLTGRYLSAGIEEVLFTGVLTAVGGLVAVLAVVATVSGLSLTKVAVGLCVTDAALVLAFRWRSARVEAPTDNEGHGRDGWERAAEWLGAVVIVAMAIHWGGAAAAVFRVTGVDADHYHVPHAVNFALGTSPFELLATTHLYPAGTSLLAAWFLLPLGDPLIVDLAVLPGFLLLVASLAWIFRVAVGRSGLAWTPWLVVLIFSTPLWRMSSLMSADLAYAAAFVALFAQLFAVRVRGAMSWLDLARAAVACGLLLGSKITGLSSAAFLLGLLAASSVVRPIAFGDGTVSRTRRLTFLAGAVVLATLTGGFWLVRNWVNYGSPVAPMGVQVLGRTVFPGPVVSDPRFEHSSARGDLRSQPHQALRVVGWSVRKWLGVFFVPSLLGLVIVPLEFLLARSRASPADRSAHAQRVLWWGVIGASSAVLWWTAGLPWTSLTRTEGMSLRFVLPVWALLPLGSLIACFSPLVPWHCRPAVRNLVLAVLIAGSVGIFLHRQATVWSADAEGRPGLGARSLALSVLVLGGPLAAGAILSRPVAVGIGVAIVLGSTVAGARVLATRDWLARSADRADLDRLEACLEAGGDAGADHFRRVFLQARLAESARNVRCSRRRFFVGTRFDDPLGLQPVPYASLVFDARRPGADFFDAGEQLHRGLRFLEGALAEAQPGQRPDACDYVVVDVGAPDEFPISSVMAGLRERGRLREIGRVGRFLIYAAGE